MKKLTLIATLMMILTISAFAQTSDEKAVLKFIADYDQAYMKQDITFVEKNFAEDYFIVADGRRRNRTEMLADIRKDIAATQTMTRDSRSTNESLRVVGNLAVATGLIDWKETAKNDPNAAPSAGKERYTLVWEKRGGKWTLISEHISTVSRDRKMMEAEVMKASSEYGEIVKHGDFDKLESMLADNIVVTNESGKVRNKAEELASYKNRDYKLALLEISDQKVQITDDYSAVETGTVHYKGTDKNGKPMEGYERYTTTWVRRGGRWQIIADHVSDVKK